MANMESAIKAKREIMIKYATQYGFTDEITLQCSQELDKLIYEYQCFFHRKKLKGFLIFENSQNLQYLA
jgi:hypothetical protein